MQVKNTVPIRRNNQEITVKIKGELYREEVAGGRFRRLDIHKNGQPVLWYAQMITRRN